jgi:hypothetical protein
MGTDPKQQKSFQASPAKPTPPQGKPTSPPQATPPKAPGTPKKK